MKGEKSPGLSKHILHSVQVQCLPCCKSNFAAQNVLPLIIIIVINITIMIRAFFFLLFVLMSGRELFEFV